MNKLDTVIEESKDVLRVVNKNGNFENAKEKYLGKTFKTKSFGTCVVVEYVNAYRLFVKFHDGTVVSTRSGDLVRGEVKNPNHPSVHNIGYTGQGGYLLNTPVGVKWESAMTRSYSKKYQEGKPSYEGCTVHPDWHCFQNFAEWAYKQIGVEDGFSLDKDLLCLGNRVYGEDYCCFLPSEVNSAINIKQGSGVRKLPVGVVLKPRGKYKAQCCVNGKQEFSKLFNEVGEAFLWYKKTKESVFKHLAEKWRGKISDDAYAALINLRVNEGGLYDNRR